MISEVSRDIED